jgi:hypothetical protein
MPVDRSRAEKNLKLRPYCSDLGREDAAGSVFSRYIRRIDENDKKETVSSNDVSVAGKEMCLDRREGYEAIYGDVSSRDVLIARKEMYLDRRERVMYRLVMSR